MEAAFEVERTRGRPRVNVVPSHYPGLWMFSVEHRGKTWCFTGTPNYCRSRRAAIRGWWRARWMMDGTFERRYVS